MSPAPWEPDFLLVSMSDFSLGRGLFMARAASLSGRKVAVITNKPVYGRRAPLGGYPDLRFVTIPVPPLPYDNTLGRIIIYVSFAVLSFFQMVRYRKANVLYIRGMHPFVDFAALGRRFFVRRTRIIADITDLWPDALAFVPLNTRVRRGLIMIGHAINRIALPRVDDVVTHNELLGRVLEKRFSKTPSVIYGVLDLDLFRPMDKKAARRGLSAEARGPLSGGFTVMYAGLLGQFQNPETILRLGARVNRGGIRLVVAGTGPLKGKLESEARDLGLQNVAFLPTQPFDTMPALYGSADVLLMTYADLDFLMIGLPKKFIEYASAGKPIVYLGPPCVAASLVREWNCGAAFSSSEVDEAGRFIESLLADPAYRDALGKNSRRMAESLFSIEGARRVLSPLIAR